MTSTETSDGVDFEVRVEARPEIVFQFFTDPVKMMRWKGVDAALDPHPGGIYHVNITGRETVKGEYVEIVPYSRIVFTWGWEGGPVPPGSSLVEVSFIADGNATIVKLRHSGLAAEAIESHSMGWEHYLPRLAIAAAGNDPGQIRGLKDHPRRQYESVTHPGIV